MGKGSDKGHSKRLNNKGQNGYDSFSTFGKLGKRSDDYRLRTEDKKTEELRAKGRPIHNTHYEGTRDYDDYELINKRNDDKGKPKRPVFNDGISDSDSLLDDNSSVLSGESAVLSVRGEKDLGNVTKTDDFDDDAFVDVADDFDEKFEAVIDGLQVTKYAQGRLLLWESLAKAFQKRLCTETIIERKFTLREIIERALKRNDEEAGAAAYVLSLILISLGNADFSEEIFTDLFDQLEHLVMDKTAKPGVRGKCAVALSVGTFITDFGLDKTRQVLHDLLSVALPSVKGHLDASELNAINIMRAACLDMFSFLVSIKSDEYMMELMEKNITKLIECLDEPNLAIRISAGECIVLLLEKSRQLEQEKNYEFEMEEIDDVCEKLRTLATESNNWRSKKDLRQQRANFRQLLHFIESDEFGSESIKFGRERMELENWQLKRYYDTFCAVLASGMNLHLQKNQFLRDVFDLGLVPSVDGDISSKYSKNYMNNVYTSNRKARELVRAKQHDKRAAFDFHE